MMCYWVGIVLKVWMCKPEKEQEEKAFHFQLYVLGLVYVTKTIGT